MKPPTRLRRLLVPAVSVLVLAGTLSGCSHDRPSTGDPIDARSFFDDYPEAQGENAGTAPQALSGNAGAAADGSGVPGPLEDDTFVDAGVSGFVDTARDARSTFALDVDNGSFTVARTLLGQGLLPPAASVRPEEWVNAFHYADAPPTGTDLGVTTETGLAPTLDDGTQLVRVAVDAREPDPQRRTPVNVTLVVDRSGSMDIRERLGLVKSSLALLADHLAPDDTISVVSFDDRATSVLPPTRAGDTEAVLGAIRRLTPGGSTNLAAGLRLGYAQAREDFRDGGVNVVVLCSDGVANVGTTGPGGIVRTITREGRAGIHLVTVGFGMGNYNDHLMEQLADRGDGFYRYVDTFAEAEHVFVEELATTLTPVAAQARTQVDFDPAAVASYRLVGYDNRALADGDFTDMTRDAGELGAGHQATALYEVRVRPGVEPGAVIGSAHVRWVSVATGETGEVQAEVVAAIPGAAPSPSLALASSVADLAQLLKGEGEYADRGVTLPDLEARARSLADAGVAGGAELLDLVLRAEKAPAGPSPLPVE